jgi:dipeptidyl aminopeptidase/acylaminoacyl peptidase
MAVMTTPLTASLITSCWQPGDVRLSPDGRYVAWDAAPYGRAGEHDEGAVWVAPTGGSEPARQWTQERASSHPRWSPDGSRLAIASDRAEPGVMGLYVLPVAGGEAVPVVVRKRSISVFAWSPDGRSLAFLAPDEPDEDHERREKERDDPDVHGERWERHRLHVVTVDTREVTTLLAADLHLTDLAWSPDGSRIAVTARPTPVADDAMHASVLMVPSAGGEHGTVCAGGDVNDLTWTADGRRLVYVASHDTQPQSSYTVWSVPADRGQTPVTIGPGTEDEECGIGVRAVAGEPRVVILVAEGLDTRLEWCDPETGAREELWTADGSVATFAVAPGPVVAVVASQGVGLPEVWTGRPHRLSRVSDHHTGLAAVRFGAVEDFHWHAPDGLMLDGILIRPATEPGMPAGPAAMVVLPHGGPYGRSGRDLHVHPLDWGQWLATAGYAVLMPNYRGGLGRGNRFAQAVRGDMGGAEWGDVLSAVDAAVERGIADPSRLGIGGWSQGGFLTAWGVTQTDRFSAAVMGAGISDWGMMSMTSDVPTFEGTLAGDQPWNGPGPHRGAERSPISYAAHCRTPLLILHGQDDERVPVSQGIGFHRALLAMGSPVELVTYPREPHGIRERRHQEDLLERVRAWFDRWLKPDATG